MDEQQALAASSVARRLAAQQSTERRAHRKQYLVAKRALQPALLAVREHSVAKSNRGGAGTAAKCSQCGQPRKGTHKQTGCPFIASTG